jgi:nitroimidazol reductase NimA-like FMN-containing flavoprotein (pyridoxamine 5'-phosphate oxidase superfamily)
MSESLSGPVRALQPLDRDACLERLATVAFGRVGWATSTGTVVILPVNFVLDGGTIVFGTGLGEKLTAIRDGRRISFQADNGEWALHSGWSVLITGTAEVVQDAEQARRLEHLHLATWAPVSERFFVRLLIDEVTGRLLTPGPGGVTVQRIDS